MESFYASFQFLSHPSSSSLSSYFNNQSFSSVEFLMNSTTEESNPMFTLRDLLDCDDILPEFSRGEDEKLVKYITKPENIRELVQYLVYSIGSGKRSEHEKEGEEGEGEGERGNNLSNADNGIFDSNNRNNGLDIIIEKKENNNSGNYLNTDIDVDLGHLPVLPYPYIASEIFCSDSPSGSLLLSFLIADYSLLDLLFSPLDRAPPLDPSVLSYFRKVVQVLIQHYYNQLTPYLMQKNILPKLIHHIGVYSIMELIIMIAWEPTEGVDRTWLEKENLVPLLIDSLSIRYENIPDTHTNAGRALVDLVVKTSAQDNSLLLEQLTSTNNLTTLFNHMFNGSNSSLTNCLSVGIVLVQRYANYRNESEAIQAIEAQRLEYVPPRKNRKEESNDIQTLEPNSHKDLTSDLSRHFNQYLDFTKQSSIPSTEPFASLLPHLPKICHIFSSSLSPSYNRYDQASASLTSPSLTGFGSLRLKIVELVLVLIRCNLPDIDCAIIQLGILPTMLEAFFNPQWHTNNLMHGLMESIITSAVERQEKFKFKISTSTPKPFQETSLVTSLDTLHSRTQPDTEEIHNLPISPGLLAVGENEDCIPNLLYCDVIFHTPGSMNFSNCSSSLSWCLFHRYDLISVLTSAFEVNRIRLIQGKSRCGYMGHLIRTALAIQQILKGKSIKQKNLFLGRKKREWEIFIQERLEEELEKQRGFDLSRPGEDKEEDEQEEEERVNQADTATAVLNEEPLHGEAPSDDYSDELEDEQGMEYNNDENDEESNERDLALVMVEDGK